MQNISYITHLKPDCGIVHSLSTKDNEVEIYISSTENRISVFSSIWDKPSPDPMPDVHFNRRNARQREADMLRFAARWVAGVKP